jgi:hypothetical protein
VWQRPVRRPRTDSFEIIRRRNRGARRLPTCRCIHGGFRYAVWFIPCPSGEPAAGDRHGGSVDERRRIRTRARRCRRRPRSTTPGIGDLGRRVAAATFARDPRDDTPRACSQRTGHATTAAGSPVPRLRCRRLDVARTSCLARACVTASVAAASTGSSSSPTGEWCHRAPALALVSSAEHGSRSTSTATAERLTVSRDRSHRVGRLSRGSVPPSDGCPGPSCA